jgi:hypothetical protein
MLAGGLSDGSARLDWRCRVKGKRHRQRVVASQDLRGPAAAVDGCDGVKAGSAMARALFAGIGRQRLRGSESIVRASARVRAVVYRACDGSGFGSVAEHRSAFVRGPPALRAGRSTIFVDDLDAVFADIASRRIEPDERETYPGEAEAIYRAPDGNQIEFGGPIE